MFVRLPTFGRQMLYTSYRAFIGSNLCSNYPEVRFPENIIRMQSAVSVERGFGYGDCVMTTLCCTLVCVVLHEI